MFLQAYAGLLNFKEFTDEVCYTIFFYMNRLKKMY